ERRPEAARARRPTPASGRIGNLRIAARTRGSSPRQTLVPRGEPGKYRNGGAEDRGHRPPASRRAISRPAFAPRARSAWQAGLRREQEPSVRSAYPFDSPSWHGSERQQLVAQRLIVAQLGRRTAEADGALLEHVDAIGQAQ